MEKVRKNSMTRKETFKSEAAGIGGGLMEGYDMLPDDISSRRFA
jgi:hypothetical protein